MMELLKHSWKGLVFTLGLFTFNFVLWFNAIPLVAQPFESVLAQALGGWILTSFFLVFLLSTRLSLLVHWFGGMDRMYFYHRWFAILPLAVIMLHEELSESIIEVFNIESPILGEANDAGETAQQWFIALIVIALLAKYLKYEHWRFIHRLMIIPFIYGLFHAFYSATYDLFDGSWLSIFMMTIAIGGMLSSFYMVFMYQWMAFHFKGKVTHITYPNPTTIDIEITLKKPLRYRPGQFSFLKIFQRGIEDAPHPFSISGSDGNKVYFTIKRLGDFTKQVITSLKIGTTISLTRAYGTLTMQEGGPKQVWIAGGIGLTPFLAHLRQPNVFMQTIDFYYSYRNDQEAVMLEEMKALAQRHPNLTLHLHNTAKQGYLGIQHLVMDPDAEVYLCGPRMMVGSLVKAIKKQNPNQWIDFEAFTFMGTLIDDLWFYTKKILSLFIVFDLPKKK